jgi:UDP-N-acetylmuramoyl-L-alanyl-D-glutamate--2,6-diaminopimelate ligase
LNLKSWHIAELFEGIALASPIPAALATRVSTGIHFDSRRITPGMLFMAFAGANVDGRSFSTAALEAGAVAVVSELPPLPGLEDAWIQVAHGRQALALIARKLFGDPTRNGLDLYGVTGTNGKTTTSYILASILKSAGYHTGLFGTIEYRIGDQVLSSVNTTPESIDLYGHFAALTSGASRPCAVAMEVSSHALSLGRVWGLHYRSAIWTNLTRDHLDFHGDMESYFAAKCELFRGQDTTPPAVAAINFDDEYGRRVPVAASTDLWSFALRDASPATRVRALNIEIGFAGLNFDLVTPLGRRRIHSPMLGEVNVSNILGAACAALGAGVPLDAVEAGIASCPSVPGRFERVDSGQPFLVIVDYSHTDDAIRNAIRVARALKPARVITVFGCGGDRDRTKRPLMGAAAAEASDHVILTSDNPRTEDPIAIMNDALVGLRRFDTPHTIEPDRAKAIQKAIAMARPNDIILLAGKGHEDYQIIGKTKHPFDDRLVAREALAAYGYSPKEAAQ